jgi:hypothetical protein
MTVASLLRCTGRLVLTVLHQDSDRYSISLSILYPICTR